MARRRYRWQPGNRLLCLAAIIAVLLASLAVGLNLRQAGGRTSTAGTAAITTVASEQAAAETKPTGSGSTRAAGSTNPTSEMTEPAETIGERDRTSIIPDGPAFDVISPDGNVDYRRIDYRSLVPAGRAAPDAYFDDALFLGNSIQQIQRQIGSIRADYITTGDYNVFRYFEWDLNMPDGQKMTSADYLTTKTYGKIYLTFGINEVSYDDQEAVWRGFRALLEDVRQKQPDAIIYLVGLLPVYPPNMNETARALITPQKILEFNHKLAILAEDEGVYMLNPAEALQDENGYLKAEWSKDGVHFGKAATDLWDSYTRTHTVTP